jgi:calcineurin-like phosphoesterase family protein
MPFGLWQLSRVATIVAVLVAVPACGRRDDIPAAAPVVEAMSAPAQEGVLTLPVKATSVKFAVIGDSGRGTPPQFDVAAQMIRYRAAFPFAFVLMLGDNIYEGPATAEDYRAKFEEPYRPLLDKDVEFFAVLGNHDDPREVSYAPFNMHGERYYSFAPPEDLVTRIATRVEFFALDSTNLDATQLRWLDERLGKSRAAWKICFLHHPLYTSGRYRKTALLHRWALEPILIKHGVQVVFSGHEHIYQRTAIERGVQYFISGGAGSLREGDGVAAPDIARTFSADYHFMLIEIDGDDLYFQAISRRGATIDAGRLTLPDRDHGDDDRAGRAVTPPGTAARP